jgi:hypothetical protein
VATSRQEAQWVLRAQCNDREALELLLRSVQPSLHRYLSGLMSAAAGRVGGNAAQTKIQFASVAAQMLFVTLCTVIVALYITRMTRTILRAIELISKERPK